MFDVVYPLKRQEQNDELRFSLRSLANFPHRGVFIAGYCPDWVSDVTYIPRIQNGSKYDNSRSNIVAACRHPDLSDDFILMNDDIYVLSPQEAAAPAHSGEMDTYMASFPHRGKYWDLMVATRALLDRAGIERPYFYELHIPTVLNKDRLLDMLYRFAGDTFMMRTLYHNLYTSGGTERKDVKKYHLYDRLNETDYLSTSDIFGRLPMFKNYMRKRFPEPCYYEAMKKYTYQNKQTGKRVQSDTPLKDKNLVLVSHIRDGQMKGHNIRQK